MTLTFNNSSFKYLLTLIAIFLTSCDISKIQEAQVDLEQIADQIIITYPANYAAVTESNITVRADIPPAANATEVTLYVDGLEVAKDTDGAPWEISWPAYYWSDGQPHTLLLKTITSDGNEVRNNQHFEVLVSTQANKDLKFSNGLNGKKLKDENNLTVDFAEFPGATRYELQYSVAGQNQSVNSDLSSVYLSDLGVGDYELRYRAIKEFSSLTTITGSWSDPVYVEVSPPDLPLLNEPVITVSNVGYDLSLSWQDMGVNNSYEIYLKNLAANTQALVYSTTGNSILIPSLEMGKYSWQLKRTNSLNQESLVSAEQLIDVGVFTKHFGGSKDDRARQIISSKDGGYIILALTQSSEVSEFVDSLGDDWILRVNDNGELIWEYISNASGRDRINDVIELADGSIILVGNDWDSKKAVAIKLDKDGNKIWETLYRPEAITDRYDFIDVVEFNGNLYASSAVWGQGSCSSCTIRVGYFLHTIALTDGVVSDAIDIPLLSELKIDSVAELEVTNDGNLLIAGYAYPEVHDPYSYYYEGGAYLQVLDANLDQLLIWNNVGDYFQGNVGDAINLVDGKFAVIGQGTMGVEPTISVINSDGSLYRNYVGTYGQEHYGSQPIVSDEDGKIYGLFLDQSVNNSPYPVTFMELNSNLVVENQSYFLDFKEYVQAVGLIKNSDGSFTFLINEGQNGYNDYDIVITKR